MAANTQTNQPQTPPAECEDCFRVSPQNSIFDGTPADNSSPSSQGSASSLKGTPFDLSPVQMKLQEMRDEDETWADFAQRLHNGKYLEDDLIELDDILKYRTFLVGCSLTTADVIIWKALALKSIFISTYKSITRWYNLLGNSSFNGMIADEDEEELKDDTNLLITAGYPAETTEEIMTQFSTNDTSSSPTPVTQFNFGIYLPNFIGIPQTTEETIDSLQNILLESYHLRVSAFDNHTNLDGLDDIKHLWPSKQETTVDPLGEIHFLWQEPAPAIYELEDFAATTIQQFETQLAEERDIQEQDDILLDILDLFENNERVSSAETLHNGENEDAISHIHLLFWLPEPVFEIQLEALQTAVMEEIISDIHVLFREPQLLITEGMITDMEDFGEDFNCLFTVSNFNIERATEIDEVISDIHCLFESGNISAFNNDEVISDIHCLFENDDDDASPINNDDIISDIHLLFKFENSVANDRDNIISDIHLLFQVPKLDLDDIVSDIHLLFREPAIDICEIISDIHILFDTTRFEMDEILSDIFSLFESETTVEKKELMTIELDTIIKDISCLWLETYVDSPKRQVTLMTNEFTLHLFGLFSLPCILITPPVDFNEPKISSMQLIKRPQPGPVQLCSQVKTFQVEFRNWMASFKPRIQFPTERGIEENSICNANGDSMWLDILKTLDSYDIDCLFRIGAPKCLPN